MESPEWTPVRSICCMTVEKPVGVVVAFGGQTAIKLTKFLDRQGIPLKGIIFNRFQPGNRMHEDNVKLCETSTATLPESEKKQ